MFWGVGKVRGDVGRGMGGVVEVKRDVGGGVGKCVGVWGR